MKQIVLKIIYNRLASVARRVISRHRPVVIAITGSVGKTSAKEIIYKILAGKYPGRVRATYGNLNAEIGIPLTVLGYTEQPAKKDWPIFLLKIQKHLRDKNYPKYLILEMGVEHPGDIKKFCQIARPDFAVITAATAAHVCNFKDLDAMQKEKISIASCVKKGGQVIYNSDDKYLMTNIGDDAVGYGINNKQYCWADEIKISITGNSYLLCTHEGSFQINSKLVGRQMIYSELAAASLALKMAVEPVVIKQAIEARKPYQGRLNVLPGRDDTTIIDDTYNANPASVRAAADLMKELESKGRKVIILGNMNELGAIESEQHLEIASYIDGKADLILLAGPNAAAMANNIKLSQVIAFRSRLEIERDICNIVNRGDLILVKASQNNNYFEELVKILIDGDLDAEKILVRQGKMWKNKKFVSY